MNDFGIDTLNKDYISNAETFSNDEKINVVIQAIVDGYLKKNKKESMEELLKKDNIPNKPGQLYGYHIMLMQTMIQEEFNIIGVDLKTLVEKNGETFVVGKVSELEKKIIMNKVENIAGILQVIRERKENK